MQNSHFQNFNQEGIDPSELSLDTNFPTGRSVPIQQQGGFVPQNFGDFNSPQQGFNFSGSGGIATDELIGLGDLNHQQSGAYEVDFNVYSPLATGVGGLNVNQDYSQTPHDNAPPESPFIKNFPHNSHLRGGVHGSFPSNAVESPASYNASPVIRSADAEGQGTFFDSFMIRNRQTGSVGSQPIGLGSHHRHQKSLSGHWDGTPGSGSYPGSSALSSPHSGSLGHMPMSENLLKGGPKHASLPAKVDLSQTAPVGGGIQSQEAKRRRRRESHNMVERRRRDNINERIQELSHLVPHHRLEDEKVRKHLMNNSPLSPTVGASGSSPPRATSGLAGPGGRRAASIGASLGPAILPGEEKDKGPNKGDILNGAVGWTRDLMWALNTKLMQEKDLRELIQKLGGSWPFEETEDQLRMESELVTAVERNGIDSFSYSRGPGTGLRVPQFTDIAGHSINPTTGSSAPLLSSAAMTPVRSSGRNGPSTPGSASGVRSSQGQTPQHMWGYNAQLKEEDEYGMDVS